MATEWVIKAGAERFSLDEQNRGMITFTVTNQGTEPDRAVLEAVPGDGADRSWFNVKEPQRPVRPGASVDYLMTATVPRDTKAGAYWVQGRVYGADTAPEETSRLSDRVMFEVKQAATPKRPWWPYAVAAALVIVVLAVVGVLVFGSDGPQKATTPNVTNQSRANAERILGENGLTPGKVTKVADNTRVNGIVVDQQPQPGQAVRDDHTVDLTVVDNPAPRRTLTVAVTGGGGVSGNGIACPPGCNSEVVAGTEITLTATASLLNVFDGWGGACAGTTSVTCQFTMGDAPVSVSAKFSPLALTFTPAPDPNPIVPNVRDLTATDARTVLQNAGFTVQQNTAVDNLCNSLGAVRSQTPTGGTRAPRGSTVTITIGVPPRPPRECP